MCESSFAAAGDGLVMMTQSIVHCSLMKSLLAVYYDDELTPLMVVGSNQTMVKMRTIEDEWLDADYYDGSFAHCILTDDDNKRYYPRSSMREL